MIEYLKFWTALVLLCAGMAMGAFVLAVLWQVLTEICLSIKQRHCTHDWETGMYTSFPKCRKCGKYKP